MQLTGKSIQLSPFDYSDKDLFIELSMSPKMMEHVYNSLTYDEAKAAFEAKAQPWSETSDSWLTLGITEIVSGEKLGSIGIKIVDREAKIAEVGFMMKPSAQGKGFASEALTLLKDYVFTERKLNKLTAICSVNNTGSYKLLEKLGFQREGCLRQNTLINDKLVDDYVYGLLTRKDLTNPS
ncbi:GNAT family N-acetyltransferase [Colwellia psychrerythraea]|uniref:GCN5-related N-acetyltransferase n=1 Tax=Colwellia psychrerythraea TaxID=28229 RepID=A0A099KPZ9_COLPS|nr:GNAT family protein [Colwellia psychrerythraea]KGJ91698.1 GCN5-related N-acetyltransferase [Colwellia psychrerythraea]